jgi:hypothetical protein
MTAVVEYPVLNRLAVPIVWTAVSSVREGGVQLDADMFVKAAAQQRQ